MRNIEFNNRGKARYIVNDDGCWIWQLTKYRVKGGTWYGRYKESPYGKHFQAHRWVYEKLVGKIPDKLHLHHTCNNSLCVNPDHLKPISPSEHTILHNKTKKFRTGPMPSKCKFNYDEAEAIFIAKQIGMSYTDISELFGASMGTICSIINKEYATYNEKEYTR